MFDSTDSPGTDAPPAMTRAERRMLKLERLGDIGLAIAEKLGREAERASAHAESEIVPDNLPHSRRLGEIAKAYAQVSRAAAICTAMEDRIDKGLPALPDVDRARRLRDQALEEKREAVRSRVVNAIDADPTILTARRRVDLRLRLDGLLDREVRDLDRFLDRPFPELVERLRVNLGLEPDEEAWAQTSPPSKAAAFGGGGPPNGGGGGLETLLARPLSTRPAEAAPDPVQPDLPPPPLRGPPPLRVGGGSLRRGLRSRTGDRSRLPP